jgi:hypothetical protein
VNRLRLKTLQMRQPHGAFGHPHPIVSIAPVHKPPILRLWTPRRIKPATACQTNSEIAWQPWHGKSRNQAARIGGMSVMQQHLIIY